ncbi:hydantoinase/oxoprolinase family protein [Nocardioides cavernae]|uniref:Hydantoinase/oxoprolinase family protein n=1 Tax=Nocardioides cavernae TaxID=1921566 RepID=A0ABR8NBI2_9ACTN|nr:hydantoinase/oxoprolinase family protein [Nocardioides cavernae]MBD3924224.1 hydantoinase/oxoprolinase family protein [Nocardioides cavernae]MBM7510837.1 N-methylhydantoinase A [Nocardioides cavernae]
MRFAVDTGGTFTDLVIEDAEGHLNIYKSPTTPSDPVQGILDAFAVAAEERGVLREDLLASGSMLFHGTTRGLNAVLTGNVARTALVATEGHPDMLLLREGGRTDIFNQRRAYPEPYVPRSLTFEVAERVDAQGAVVTRLTEDSVRALADQLRAAGAEAVAVCLLWSIVNPEHELLVGRILHEELPDVPVTLSHQLNPALREYRRASSAAIDASLKPLMTTYIAGCRARLAEAGFDGRLLMMTSSGGALDAAAVAEAPIHSLNSGPSMAPVAGRFFSSQDAESDMAIVADTGGTSYDVSVVRDGRIPWTRESWIGQPFIGNMTGFPSVDVRSVGAGGGSLAYVDAGGMLHVGPESASAVPGPACYGRGGDRPTMTDACLVLGYLDPDYFLGGRSRLDLDAATTAIEVHVAEPLGISVHEAAAAIWELATEHMVGAIEEITSHQGIDASRAVLVGGGGAAGFNTVAIGRRLSCPEVIVPLMGPALSASGALISELARGFEVNGKTSSDAFDHAKVEAVVEDLTARCREFIDDAGDDTLASSVEFAMEARYPSQVWTLQVPVDVEDTRTEDGVARLVEAFHAAHRETFAVADDNSPIEIESWHARASCRLSDPETPDLPPGDGKARTRQVFLAGSGWATAAVWRLDDVPINEPQPGPALVETATTAILVDDGATFMRRPTGTLHVVPGLPPERSPKNGEN